MRGKPRPVLILGICCLSLFLASMDVSIVNVALPAIQQHLGAALSELQWVVDAYTLVVASLLLLTGSMADRFGRRRVFQIGLAVFTLGSLFCSLAPGVRALIAFRAIQGVGASMLSPVALAIVVNTFDDPKSRARAIGVWGAVFGVALGLGPVIGGMLTQTVGWRFIFIVNLPVGLAAVLLTALFVPESKAAHPRTIDPVGQVLVVICLSCMTYALIEGQHLGWNSGFTLGLFAVAGASVVALLLYEPRRADPLLELRFFRSVPFSAATLIAVAAFGSLAALLFLNALYLQQVRGFSAFQTGLCTLPLAVMALLCGPVSGHMVGRLGTRPSLLLAGAAILASTLPLLRLSSQSSIPLLLCSYAMFGIGIGMVNPPISTVAVSGMPRSRAGVAAAIASTSRQVGASFGVALAGAIVNSGRGHGTDFAGATHPVWWAVAGCGGAIFLLGWATTTPWGQRSARQVAATLQPAGE